MCAPVVAGVMIAGAVVSTIASVKGGSDAKKANNEAAKQAIQGAKEEASDRLQRAAIDAGDIAAQGASIAASHVAAAGGSNVSGGTTGSALLQSNLNAARDQAMVKANAAREAWGIRRQGARQADSLRKTGKAAFESGILGGVGAGIGGIGSAAATYYSLKDK